MKSKIVISVSLCLGALIVAVPVFAHHSSFAFDNENALSIKGRVTEWYWANPHCLLKLDVMNDSGEIVSWVAETQAPANMIDAGWRRNDLKPGDEVTVTVRPAKNHLQANYRRSATPPAASGTTVISLKVVLYPGES